MFEGVKGVVFHEGIWILSLKTSTGLHVFFEILEVCFHPHFARGDFVDPLGPDQPRPPGGLKGSHGVKGKLRSEGKMMTLGGCVGPKGRDAVFYPAVN